MPATYSVVPTVATGDWITAGWVNTYIGTNLAANWPGTTTGDLEYYLSSVEKARLAPPASNAILQHSGAAPSWLNKHLAQSLLKTNPTATGFDWVSIGAKNTFLSVNAAGVAYEWRPFYRYQQALLNAGVALVAGDDAFRFRIPAALNGWDIATVAMSRKAGTGVLTVQIRNVSTAVDVLSTKLTIDSGETDSSSAAAAAVINTANDGVLTGQQFAIDVDDAGTNSFFAFVEIGFLQP